MLGRGVLSRLHTLTQKDSPTLTLYLDIDQNTMSNRNRGYVVQAEALLKELRSRAADDGAFERAAARALELVEAVEPQGRSALVVVHADGEPAEVHQAKVRLPASVHWRRGAFLRPVVEAMDEHERYGVVLTDSTRARLFTVQLGEITEHEDLLSDTVPRTRAVGADQWRAQKRHDRRHDEEAASHAKRVIDALHDLALQAPFDRLIVGGPTKATAQLVRLLPRRLHGKLVETLAVPLNASKGEVLERILGVQEEMERHQEAELVEALSAELHDGGKAVVELPSVLDAVNQARVWALVYRKGLRVEGGECRACGGFTASAAAPCIYCGGAVEPLPQCIDVVSQRVLDIGGRVQVVAGPAAERLDAMGSIGALLRY